MSTKNQTKNKTGSNVGKSTSKKTTTKNTKKTVSNKTKTNKTSVNKNIEKKKSTPIKEVKTSTPKIVKEIKETKDIKTIVIPTLLMVITFFVLIVGATYAYFTVTTTSSSSSSKVYTNAESVGISTLKTGNNLSLNLTLVDMMVGSEDITYYATLDGTPSTDEVNEVIGSAEVTGNGTMECNYVLEVSSSGTMYTAFQNMSSKSEGQLVLNVNGTDYDLYNITFPLSINGTLENVKEGSEKDITASFKIVNKKEVDQSALAGKNIVLSFSVQEYKCEIVG